MEYRSIIPQFETTTNKSGGTYSIDGFVLSQAAPSGKGDLRDISNAFDKKDNTTTRSSIIPASGEYIQMIFPQEYLIARYTITVGHHYSNGDLKTWELQGLVDSTWTVLHRGSHESKVETLTFDFPPQYVSGIRIVHRTRHATNSWGVAELEVFELIFSQKILIEHENVYKTYNQLTASWETVSEVYPTKEQFLTQGIDIYLDENISALNEIEDDFEIVLWTEDIGSILALRMNALPHPQLVYPESDISLAGTDAIDKITLTANENAKVAISFDSGLTWKAYKNSAWITVADAHSGMTANEINALTREQIAEARGDSQFVRFSYSLSDHAENDRLEMLVTLQGSERILPTDAYDLDYDSQNKTIIYTLKRNMTLSVNYVDG